MKRLLLFSFLLEIGFAFGQGYVPPSPDAMGLFRLSNTSVNYYTGTLSTTIPLAQLPGKELSASVSLAYNASGFKVHEIASSTGLGWNLVAGGVITRIVRGIPDDLTNGYCKPAPTDPEPDLFFYSFMGRSGKFFITATGQAYTIPYQDIKIKPGICAYGSDGTWEITDENGVVYRFGKTTSERETSTVKKMADNSTLYTYLSSWYLSEVETPNKTDKVTFSYYTTSNVTYKNFYFTKYDQCNPDLSLKNESTIVTSNPRLVTYITTAQGSISFTWQYGREDLAGGHYLSMLQVYAGGQQIKKYRFQYGYFQANGCATEYCKRLRLDYIYDLAPDPLFSFTYNTTLNLPSRESKNFDHWGYYNSNTYDSWLPYLGTLLPGASRASDSYCLANLLLVISSREGGSQQFDYETHFDGSAGTTIGGARIKQITTTDGSGNNIVKNINYGQSGKVFFTPDYRSIDPFTGVLIKRFSSSLLQLFDLGGCHIGYSTVEEVTPGIGKIIYDFSDFSAHPDEDILEEPPYLMTYKGWERGNAEQIRVYDSQGNLLTKQNFEYDYEFPDKRKIYSGIIVFPWVCGGSSGSSGSGYAMISRPITIKKQTSETYQPNDPSKKMIQVTKYQYDPTTYLPVKIIQYDSMLPSKKIITQYRHVGHPDYTFYPSPPVNCQEQFTNCQSSCATEPDPQVQAACYADCQNQYNSCQDSPGIYASPEVAAILALRDRHQVAVPVEQIQLIQEGVTSTVLTSSLNTYQKTGTGDAFVMAKETYGLSQPIPESSFVFSKALSNGTFEKDARFRKLNSFDSYHATSGNLLQQTSFGGIQTNYTWDATSSLVTSTTMTGGVNSRTSSATYKPLVGKTSVTDANGVVTNYEYDVYNRLNMVKDGDGKALQHYRYHYQNETPGFRIDPSRTQAIVGDAFFYFSAVDIAASTGGTPVFVWDFGDGTVIDNNSTSVSHTYTSAGTYTVKLVGMNPVYGPVTRTVQVSVYLPVGITTCEDGPTTMDYCGVDQPSYGGCTVNNTTPESEIAFKATVSNGCSSSYTYAWTYRNTSGGSWFPVPYGTESTAVIHPSFFTAPGQYEFKCVITDGCGNTAESSSFVYIYQSNPGCPNGLPQK